MAGGDRDKALDAALANIERQFGKGSVMRLGEETRAALEVIPTGAIALDVALGIGGLPRGRVVEIYGPESSGKTTVALHAVANAQRAGGIVAFIDAEHALDPDYAKALGVDTDALLVSQPDSGEQALEIADMLVRSGALDLIVIDSVAALVPRAEIEGEMGDSHVGLQARLMSQALRKMTGALNDAGTTMIFINQLREKIGVMFGSPETTTGGRALKFYSSVRLDVRRIETLKDGQEMVGNRTRVKVVKNKVAPPFKQAEFDIMYGQGISREGGLIDVGVEAGLVRKAGAWYTYEGDQLGQGKENARNFLRDNPDLANELEKRILEKLGVGPQVDAPADVAAGGRADRDRLLSPVPPRRPPPVWSLPPRGPGGRCCDRGRSGRRDRHRPGRRRGLARRSGPRGRRGPRAGGRPRGGGPQDPARPAHRAGPQPLRAAPASWRRRASPTSSPSGCSTGSRRSAWSTTRRSRAPGCSPGSPARAWPAGRSPRSCAARASTTRWPGWPSTRSTRTTRWRPRGRWSAASSAPWPAWTATVAVRRLTGMLARKGYPAGGLLPGGRARSCEAHGHDTDDLRRPCADCIRFSLTGPGSAVHLEPREPADEQEPTMPVQSGQAGALVGIGATEVLAGRRRRSCWWASASRECCC